MRLLYLWPSAMHTGFVMLGLRQDLVIPAWLKPRSYGGFKIQTHIDERSLAFWALGISKITGKAPIVITTSGSAMQFISAMVEASESNYRYFFNGRSF